jgi:hypothetical protein
MSSRQKIFRSLLVAGVALCAIAAPIVNASPAAAQTVSVSVEFRTALEPYGSWQRHRHWGDVWIPTDAARDWRPYSVGHWVYSQDYGWYWISDGEEASWGLVTYHYGRWIFDDQFGWAWVPGDEWGPGWVQWRRGRGDVGWAPLPPEEVIVEYREQPQFWIFVRERDLVAPRITEVILTAQDREVLIRETVVVNRTVVLEDRRFAVNPGIPPTYIAAAYGRPISSFEVRPRVLAGTAAPPGAIEVRAEDIRTRERAREISRESALARATPNAVQPARNVPPPQALGPGERGRLGEVPPRAAQGAASNAPAGRPPNLPSTQQPRQGAIPGPRNVPSTEQPRQWAGQPLQLQGREGLGRPPSTSGAAPGAEPGCARERAGDATGA